MLEQLEGFAYKVPIILLFAVPVILALLFVVGPVIRRVRYNRAGILTLAVSIGIIAYLIAVRLDAFR